MARTLRSTRSRVGKVNLMNTQDPLVAKLLSGLCQARQVTLQHLIAESIDLLAERHGLPAVAASLDWDETPQTMPQEHLENIPMVWGPTDAYEIRVGSRGKKYECRGDKVFRMFAEDPEEMKLSAITAFLSAMAEADRDQRIALWEKSGKKQPLIDFQLEPSDRIDVQCIRISDGTIVGQRKDSILGYLAPGGEWGQWFRRRIQKKTTFEEQLIWQGLGPNGTKGDWLYEPIKGTYTPIQL